MTTFNSNISCGNMGGFQHKHHNNSCNISPVNHFCPPGPCHNIATITTGPFAVPALVSPGIPNDRLVIMLKNPTGNTLTTLLLVEACTPPPTATPATGNILFNYTTAETALPGFPINVTVTPHSCTVIELPITNLQRGTMRITATGPYNLCDCEVSCGCLEISVAGGTGAAVAAAAESPGLSLASPALTFHFEDFVLCEEEKCHEKCHPCGC